MAACRWPWRLQPPSLLLLLWLQLLLPLPWAADGFGSRRAAPGRLVGSPWSSLAAIRSTRSSLRAHSHSRAQEANTARSRWAESLRSPWASALLRAVPEDIGQIPPGRQEAVARLEKRANDLEEAFVAQCLHAFGVEPRETVPDAVVLERCKRVDGTPEECNELVDKLWKAYDNKTLPQWCRETYTWFGLKTMPKCLGQCSSAYCRPRCKFLRRYRDLEAQKAALEAELAAMRTQEVKLTAQQAEGNTKAAQMWTSIANYNATTCVPLRANISNFEQALKVANASLINSTGELFEARRARDGAAEELRTAREKAAAEARARRKEAQRQLEEAGRTRAQLEKQLTEAGEKLKALKANVGNKQKDVQGCQVKHDRAAEERNQIAGKLANVQSELDGLAKDVGLGDVVKHGTERVRAEIPRLLSERAAAVLEVNHLCLQCGDLIKGCNQAELALEAATKSDKAHEVDLPRQLLGGGGGAHQAADNSTCAALVKAYAGTEVAPLNLGQELTFPVDNRTLRKQLLKDYNDSIGQLDQRKADLRELLKATGPMEAEVERGRSELAKMRSNIEVFKTSDVNPAQKVLNGYEPAYNKIKAKLVEARRRAEDARRDDAKAKEEQARAADEAKFDRSLYMKITLQECAQNVQTRGAALKAAKKAHEDVNASAIELKGKVDEARSKLDAALSKLDGMERTFSVSSGENAALGDKLRETKGAGVAQKKSAIMEQASRCGVLAKRVRDYAIMEVRHRAALATKAQEGLVSLNRVVAKLKELDNWTANLNQSDAKLIAENVDLKQCHNNLTGAAAEVVGIEEHISNLTKELGEARQRLAEAEKAGEGPRAAEEALAGEVSRIEKKYNHTVEVLEGALRLEARRGRGMKASGTELEKARLPYRDCLRKLGEMAAPLEASLKNVSDELDKMAALKKPYTEARDKITGLLKSMEKDAKPLLRVEGVPA